MSLRGIQLLAFCSTALPIKHHEIVIQPLGLLLMMLILDSCSLNIGL